MSTSAPTYKEFVSSFPAFISLPQETVEAEIVMSASILSSAAWGNYYSLAVGLDVAHNLTMNGIVGTGVDGAFKGAIGPVSSVSAAGVSTSFNTSTTRDGYLAEEWYKKTAYGQRFLRLQSITIAPGTLTC